MRRGAVAFGLVALCLACAAERAPEPVRDPACPGALSELLVHAGTYDHADVLAHPTVRAALDRVLGDELGHLERNLAVSGAIDLVACDLVLSGNAEHRGGEENAIVAVGLVSGSVAAAVRSGDRTVVYSDATDYVGLPVAIRDWLAADATGFRNRFEMPPHARWGREPAVP